MHLDGLAGGGCVFHLHEDFLALAAKGEDVHLGHAVQLAQGVGQVYHGGELDEEGLGMAKELVLPLDDVGLAVFDGIDTAAIGGTTGWVEVDDIDGWQGQGLCVAMPHFDGGMLLVLQCLEVVPGDVAECLVAFGVNGLFHPF